MVVLAVIGLVAAIALPKLAQARSDNHRQICLANLKQIENAKSTWATEHGKTPAGTPEDGELFGPGRYLPAKPLCPAGGHYAVRSLQEPPTCSKALEAGHRLDSLLPEP